MQVQSHVLQLAAHDRRFTRDDVLSLLMTNKAWLRAWLETNCDRPVKFLQSLWDFQAYKCYGRPFRHYTADGLMYHTGLFSGLNYLQQITLWRPDGDYTFDGRSIPLLRRLEICRAQTPLEADFALTIVAPKNLEDVQVLGYGIEFLGSSGSGNSSSWWSSHSGSSSSIPTASRDTGDFVLKSPYLVVPPCTTSLTVRQGKLATVADRIDLLPAIVSFEGCGNYLTDFEKLKQLLPNVKNLDVSRNDFEGVCDVTDLPLVSLVLGNSNPYKKGCLVRLGSHSSLQEVKLDDVGAVELADMSALRVLTMRATTAYDTPLAFSAPQLQKLEFFNMNIAEYESIELTCDTPLLRKVVIGCDIESEVILKLLKVGQGCEFKLEGTVTVVLGV